MKEDAFLLIGQIMQNDNVIKEIQMSKDGFRVKWVKQETPLFFPYTKTAIQDFIEYNDMMES